MKLTVWITSVFFEHQFLFEAGEEESRQKVTAAFQQSWLARTSSHSLIPEGNDKHPELFRSHRFVGATSPVISATNGKTSACIFVFLAAFTDRLIKDANSTAQRKNRGAQAVLWRKRNMKLIALLDENTVAGRTINVISFSQAETKSQQQFDLFWTLCKLTFCYHSLMCSLTQ